MGGIKRLVDLAQSIPWQAVTAAAALAFAYVRFAAVLFYSNFGIAPEDVGFGFGQSLAQAAVAGVLLIIVALGMWLVFVVGYAVWLWQYLGRPLIAWGRQFRELWKEAERRRELWLYLLHRAAILTIVGGSLVLWRAGRLTGVGAIVAVLGLVLLFAVGERVENPFDLHAAGERPAEARAGLRGFWNQTRRAAAWALAVGAVLVLVVLPFRASRAADAVRRGQPIPVGINYLPWPAQRSTLSWLADRPAAVFAESQGHCLMYLGQANGITVVYDVDAARTLRLPSGSVAVTITTAGPDAARCPRTG